ncbi:MAG: hypothetical protein QOJ78_1422 [Pseudonocardiales bacterium]|jgi:hypothetical protein|nr:hypothetical protein [Pseudonocardiales bacterium]MDT4927188.1 hypothetical protein [Pseudonocardiales bacterium]MDT4951698.1 hypothetical protein [Pseudonocardiales bacterium]
MYAQVIYLDGPRSAEMVAASDRAGRERLTPATLADEQFAADHVATYVLRQPDGGEIVIIITGTEAMLDRGAELIMDTELLPGEDPALLPGPDRIERFTVVHAVEHGRVLEDVTA